MPFPDIHDWNSVCIKLQRLACYGACPVYHVEVHGNGDIVYNGIGGILLIYGKHRDHIQEAAVQRLVSDFKRADYFSLNDTYASSDTDLPTYITSIEFDGRKKQVVDYNGSSVGMPKAAQALEGLIDEIAQTARWRVGTPDTVPSLLREGWDFKANTEDNDKLFATAIYRPDILALFLKQGLPPLNAPNLKYNPLVEASAYDNPNLLVRLLGESENPVPKALLNLALSAAAGAAAIPNMRFLVAHGADPKGRLPENVEFPPPMISAVISGKAAVVEELVRLGANVNATDSNGHGAIAALLTRTLDESEQVRILRTLIKAGANVNAHTSESEMKQAPVFLASGSPQAVTVLRLLVAAGANVNAKDSYGRTPLMTCFDVGYARVLIELGADLFARDNSGEQAIDTARQMGDRDLAQLLEAEMRRHSKHD